MIRAKRSTMRTTIRKQNPIVLQTAFTVQLSGTWFEIAKFKLLAECLVYIRPILNSLGRLEELNIINWMIYASSSLKTKFEPAQKYSAWGSGWNPDAD